ncbi:MAG: MotA/TolQ/ExbB proton channel family protein [Flavobacteriales bacterium]|nr:MotA/TolQ/ExbB proton channel family protein [Flavobacteriales bacterium]
MNLNPFNFLYKIQDATADIADGVSELMPTEQISLWQLIWGYDSTSGEYSLTSLVVMSLLFIFSFVAVYVFIERFMAVQRALKGEKDFMQKINDFVTKGNLSEAKQLCQSSENPIARMVEKGISRVGKPMKDITTSIENIGKLEISKLERRLSMLATISGVAPMLGFLGTVLGMVKVFQNMSKEKTFEIASLSGGIMEAMITTVGGLIVGIVAYVAYNYLVSKVEKVIHNMEGASIEFIDILEAPGK